MHATREFGNLFKKAGFSTFLSASAELAAINCYFLGGVISLFFTLSSPALRGVCQEGTVDPCQGSIEGGNMGK